VLRFEATINDPSKFKIYRHTENQDKTEPKELRPMRKGVADINVRAQVSQNIVNRFTEHMASTKNDTRLSELLHLVSKPLTRKGKKIRALEPFGKDLELLRAISDPCFSVSAITNKELQLKLVHTSWAKNMSGKQLSARISRHLSLLREHGLIKKLPNQHKYELTDKGRKITTSTCLALAASIDSLLEIAA
jgi:predicted transcriptional regulator